MIGRSCSFLTTNQIPGTTKTKLNNNKNNLRLEGIALKISIALASGLGNSVGKNGIIGR